MPDEPAPPRAVSSTLRAIGRARALACLVRASGEESSALARRIAFASPPAPRRSGRRRQPPRPPSPGLWAAGGGQRVVGGGASDERRRLRMQLVGACGCARRVRKSRRGSWMSPGGRPLVFGMRV
jgi:hypothetical protein